MLQPTTLTQKGQVTIPLLLRKQLGLVTGMKIRFVTNQARTSELILSPMRDFFSFKGTIKSHKRYSKAAARKSYMKDVLAGKI